MAYEFSPALLIGAAGLVLVLISFSVRKFLWIYSFNLTGTLLLLAYSIILGDPIFITLQISIGLILIYRLFNELKSKKKR